MRKSLLLLIVCLLGALQLDAQENAKLRGKYFNLNYGGQKVKVEGEELKSDFGVGLSTGRTYYLHKKPILGMIRLGIDATWFDANYTSYTISYGDYEGYDSEVSDDKIHQIEIGMQVGPSVTVNPIGKLNVNGYFRYAPSFSGVYDGDTFMGNYATFFTAGGGVSYGVIGVGVEARWGNCKYKSLFGGGDEGGDYDDYDDYGDGDSNLKNKFSGYRVYLSFRF